MSRTSINDFNEAAPATAVLLRISPVLFTLQTKALLDDSRSVKELPRVFGIPELPVTFKSIRRRRVGTSADNLILSLTSEARN